MKEGPDTKAAVGPATTLPLKRPVDGLARGLEPTLTDASPRPERDDAMLRWLAELARSRGQPWVDLPAGTLVGGFRIERYLGSGGMGAVYQARDLELQRNVAVKVHLGTTGIERLQREAMAMAQLAHPNVVTVYAVGRYEGRAYVAMEYVPGTTLQGWLQEAPRAWPAVLALMLAAGEGLAAAHAAGFVHRDIKPGNILVGEDGRPRLVDFGLVHVPGDSTPATPRPTGSPVIADGGPSPVTPPPMATPSREMLAAALERLALTETGEVLGTPAYMAPEQLDGCAVDGRADQFAFCLVLYEALYGMRPWHSLHAGDLRRMMMSDPPATPPRHRAPAWLWPVLRRGLSRDPAARFPDMRALLEALRRPPRRRAFLAAGAALAIVAAIGASRWRAGVAPEPCERAGAPAAAIWTDDARRAMTGRFRSIDPVSGGEIATRLAERLDRWTARWRRTAIGACRAAKHGARTAVLAAASDRCLHAASTRLRSLVSRAGTASTAEVMTDLALDGEHRLPWIEECDDDARLTAVWTAAAPGPAAAPNPTDGYWVGNFGRLALREIGGEIWGVYDHDDGAVRGVIIGDTLVGWWCEVPSRRPDIDAGQIELRFVTGSKAERRIDGRWRYGAAGAWDPHWDLVWTSDEVPADLRARFADTEQFCRQP